MKAKNLKIARPPWHGSVTFLAWCTTNKTGPGGKTGALGEGGRFWVIGTILLALVPGDDIYTSSFALYVNFG